MPRKYHNRYNFNFCEIVVIINTLKDMTMNSNIYKEIEKGTLYSSLVRSLEKPTFQGLKEIAQKFIVTSDQVSHVPATMSSEYIMLDELHSQITERKGVIESAAKYAFPSLKCEEITIADYGCGQGLTSLCLLDWLRTNRGNLDNIKNVKLIDKDVVALQRALLHYSVLFPEVEVIAYVQDFLDKEFSVACDSVLTFNIFSHISDYSSNCAKRISQLVSSGQYLFMHNIILGETYTNKQIDHSKNNFFHRLGMLLKDTAGCEVLTDRTITYHDKVPRESKDFLGRNVTIYDKVPKHATRFIVSSRTKVDRSCIPSAPRLYGALFPGLPDKKLINVPNRVLWYDRPLENTHYVEHLDSENKISFSHNYVSKDFEAMYIAKADCLNPQTIRKCAERFYQGHIAHAISSGIPEGIEILKVYERAASEGVTEAYNNIGVLYSQMKYDKGVDTQEYINKCIEYFKLASQGGSTSAMMNLASLYMEMGDQESALQLYNQAASLETPEALFNLALAFDFGMLGQSQDKLKAKDLYLQCIDAISKDKDDDGPDLSLQSSCCLNLMLILWEEGADYLDILNVYSNAAKPSERLKYCKEIIQIYTTSRYSRYTSKIIEFDSEECKNKPYFEYNRALLLYQGVRLDSFGINLSEDSETALATMRSLLNLVNDKVEYAYLKKYVYNTYAHWISVQKEKNHAAIEDAWRKAAQENPDRECACMTNIILNANVSNELKREILEKYAFGSGCKTCHECTNYDEIARICPKAQVLWAEENESNEELYYDLLYKSARQRYASALYKLGYVRAKKKEYSDFNPSPYYIYLVCPPIEYKNMYPILAKDEYYEYLQAAAQIGDIGIGRNIIPYVAKLRNNEYDTIYWSCVQYGLSKNEEVLKWIYNFYKNKCGRSLETYFSAMTICEKEMISYAVSIAKITNDVNFICSVAGYYENGECWYSAREFYEIAQAKGCSDLDEKLQNINTTIEKIEEAERRERWRNSYYEEDPYTWEDSMMDALDGEPDAYWNID